MHGAVTVVTFGEAMLRLFSAPGTSLERTEWLRVSPAGAEANVAAGLARLGIHAIWISKLPRNVLGNRIAGELRGLGVDTGHIVWTAEGRVGLYFTQQGLTPEELHVVYDRQGSTFSTFSPEEIPWETVRSASLVHLTGITPALSPRTLEVSRRILSECRGSNVPVSFDVNFRSRLWTAEAAREVLGELLPGVRLLICSERDARILFRFDSAEQAARGLFRQFGADVVVITAGAHGALAWDGHTLTQVPAVPGPVVDRIGRGDAFDAGLVSGYLEGDVGLGLRRGATMAALVQARWGDLPWIGLEEFNQAMDGQRADLR